MKKILIVAALMLTAVAAGAHTPSEKMRDYLEGCRKMLSAIEHDNLGELADAKMEFAKVTIVPFEDFTPVDDASRNAVGEPEIIYTPEYATQLVKSGKITREARELPHAMRADDYDLQVWNATIAPHSTASFRAVGTGYCEMMIFSSNRNDLKLEITTPDDEFEASKISNAPASFVSWDMEEGEFIFTVTNGGDKADSFVIAIN